MGLGEDMLGLSCLLAWVNSALESLARPKLLHPCSLNKEQNGKIMFLFDVIKIHTQSVVFIIIFSFFPSLFFTVERLCFYKFFQICCCYIFNRIFMVANNFQYIHALVFFFSKFFVVHKFYGIYIEFFAI